MQKDLLERWYPLAADTVHGGFFSTFTADFTLTGPQDKFIVSQARHTWTNAMAAMRYPSHPHYRRLARHGLLFLQQVMWDKSHGGFHSLVSRNGEVKNSEKTAYGNAFGIYALAAAYKATGDTAALELAKKAFRWLEAHSHDPLHKGYFQHLQRNGTPVQRTAATPSTSDLGYKDQNSSIHLLEAFTALYDVWPDALVRERLQEMLLLIRDRITTPRGSLTLFYTPDWRPVSFRDSSKAVILKHKNLDHISFGHDVETAFLLWEASQALGLKDDRRTLTVARRMVDHALQNGWDKTLGGFFNEGYYFKGSDTITIIFDSKNWWAQAEALNTLLLMSELFPSAEINYAEKFRKQWQYIKNYLIDPEHGDWFEEGLDKEPKRRTALKGHIWKATYHQYRSLSHCIDRLRGH